MNNWKFNFNSISIMLFWENVIKQIMYEIKINVNKIKYKSYIKIK